MKRRMQKRKNVSKTTNEILGFSQKQLETYSEKDLRKLISQVATTANKRIQRFEKEYPALRSPAIEKAKAGGGFSTKGKSKKQLMVEFIRLKTFMRSPTGSISKMKRTTNSFINAIEEKGIMGFSPAEASDAITVFEQLREIDPIYNDRKYAYEAMKIIKAQDTTMDIKDRIADVQKRMGRLYEEKEELYHEITGVSGFFM